MKAILVTLSFVLASQMAWAVCQAQFSTSINNDEVTFTDQSTAQPGNIISWDWDFGDGNTASGQHAFHTYAKDGTYVACLTIATDDSCTSKQCFTFVISGASGAGCKDPANVDTGWVCPAVYIPVCGCDGVTYGNSCEAYYFGGVTSWTSGPCQTAAKCKANFSMQVSGLDIQFTDLSTSPQDPIVSWSWDFGDGGMSNQQHPKHTYAKSGTYTVCLTITTANGCTDVICLKASVGSSACQAAFTAAASGLSAAFVDASTATGNIIAWDWDFGDGNTATGQNATNTYASPGTYIVCLTIFTDDSCSSTSCDTLVVTGAGVSCEAAFSRVDSFPDVQFTDQSTGTGSIIGWLWDFGDGQQSAQQHPKHTYGQPGTYITCLTITTSDSCSSTTCDTIVWTTSIEGFQELNASLWPNPAQQAIYVDFSTAKAVTQLRVVDMVGKTHQLLRVASPQLTKLDISGLVPGYYVLYVESGVQSTRLPFIKE